MSKKSKRQVSKTPSQVVAAPVIQNTASAKQPSFNPDYSYVMKDLRRIGILAGSFIVILVALSFFLR